MSTVYQNRYKPHEKKTDVKWLCYDSFDQCKLLFTEGTEETTICSYGSQKRNKFRQTSMRKEDFVLEANCSSHVSRARHTSEQTL